VKKTLYAAQSGFTLFEILIVMATMGSMVAMILFFRVPNMQSRKDAMLLSLTNMIHLGRQEAARTGMQHRLGVKQSSGGQLQVVIQKKEATRMPGSGTKYSFEPVDFGDLNVFVFPPDTRLKAFFVEGHDVTKDDRPDLAIYLDPGVLVPHVYMQVVLQATSRADQVTFVTEPFIGSVRLEDGLVAPEVIVR
jgi:type II secretory pathway pseudopilin PulG